MIELSQFDTARTITDTLKINEQPVDLSGSGVEVKLLVRPHTAKKPTVAYDAEIVDPGTGGGVKIVTPDELVEKSGLFEVKWQALLANGKTVYIPTVGYDLMMIYPTSVPPPPEP